MPLSTMTMIIFYKPFYFEIFSKTGINGEEMGEESILQCWILGALSSLSHLTLTADI